MLYWTLKLSKIYGLETSSIIYKTITKFLPKVLIQSHLARYFVALKKEV